MMRTHATKRLRAYKRPYVRLAGYSSRYHMEFRRGSLCRVCSAKTGEFSRQKYAQPSLPHNITVVTLYIIHTVTHYVVIGAQCSLFFG